MSTQDIILLLAKYVEHESDRETMSILDYELSDRPQAALFLMHHRHALSFYRRHQNHEAQLRWLVDYFDKRMPSALKALAQVCRPMRSPALSGSNARSTTEERP